MRAELRAITKAGVMGNASVAVVVLALALAAAEPAVAAPSHPASGTPTRLVVVFQGDVPGSQRAAIRSSAGTTAVETLGRNRFQLLTPAPGESVADAVARLRRSPGVEAADPDVSLTLASVPNDPQFGQLWGLQNTGQLIDGTGGGVADADIDADLAWDRTVGSPSVTVADIDSGYRFDHPDLAPVAWTNPGEVPGDGIDNDGNGYVDDSHGWDALDGDNDPTDHPIFGSSLAHGVATAGIIGAKGNNGIGVTGVAQDARIMPLRVCTSVPAACPLSALVEGINYAGANGARAANLSLNATGRIPTLTSALAANPGTLFVASAGNDSTDNDAAPHAPCEDPTQAYSGYSPPPGTIDNVVCVAATDRADGLAGFSNFGAVSVDLGAPGVQILSTTYAEDPVYGESFSGSGFDAWTTPVPPAEDASHGFQLTSGGGNSFITTSGLAQAAGTARATQTPPISVGSEYTTCTFQYSYLLTGTGQDDSFSWRLFVDGTSVPTGAAPSTNPDGAVITKEFALPPSQTSHSVTAQFVMRRGIAGGPSPEVSIDDLGLSCDHPTYDYGDGTSFAAPYVTGAAALLFSLKPSATVAEVRNALLAGVDPLPSLSGKTATGGRLNVWKALAALVPMDTRITSGPSGSVNGTDATFTFDTNNTGNAGFECQLDGGTFAPCTSPRTYSGLATGGHSFSVRSVVEGGTDATPALRDWTVVQAQPAPPVPTAKCSKKSASSSKKKRCGRKRKKGK